MKVYVLKGSDIRTVGTIVDISTTPKPGYEEMTLEELASVRGKFVWMLYHNCIDKKYNLIIYSIKFKSHGTFNWQNCTCHRCRSWYW